MAVDSHITALTDDDLRAAVRAWYWRCDETTDRVARAAYDELEVRYVVDSRAHSGRRPTPPPVAPWTAPPPVRVASWQRPRGSTLYPEAP